VSLGEQFQDQGWAVAKGLFSPEEAAAIRGHVMELRQSARPGDDVPLDPDSADPLSRYPRLMHPHRYDEVCRAFMLDKRIGEALRGMMGEEPAAVQTMVYFKPPGSRGQALHQDQFYLRVKPATCVAAWMALDLCDEENGGMMVVPGTQDLPVLCPIEADTTASFTAVTVPLPEGAAPVTPRLEPGDVLFFNGSLVHGSGPNLSEDRWRRAIIGHYAPASTASIGSWYGEAWSFEGEPLSLPSEGEDTRCGVFVPGGIQMRDQDYAGPLHAH
jgi:ectoine hydroxylase-related dioxygenase (phytanoyl-CoA dioxygenase family)